MSKPYSEACERNKQIIAAKLTPWWQKLRYVLEIGSGTGQHSAYFCQQFANLTWQSSDLPEQHEGILAWQEASGCRNFLPPLALDLRAPWPVSSVEAIYTANTLHIVSEALVQRFFSAVGEHLMPAGYLFIYGPFNRGGEFTSASNAQFDVWLKMRDTDSGIRDIEWILMLAAEQGLRLEVDFAMPANNRLLVFKRQS
ncbi:DUF938 domain-containing protein [Pseudoalteromonas fenneropenaei]|uniref:DUF938 domain-containing protein n=1 Tax=Pseudoalteromonas fenneropenaei TaxID=1737459 RepID=A0ABV7CQ74_9GAMM